MEIITLANQKGGVGKTTSALMLAKGLADRGYKVLGIDLDQQANFTTSAGFIPDACELSIFDLLQRRKENIADQVILHSPSLGIDLLPGSIELANADMRFVQTGREQMLKKVVETIKSAYDYIIIDTGPNLGILTSNALTCSDKVIVPMNLSTFSIKGLLSLKDFVDDIIDYSNPDLKIDGILINTYEPNANIRKELEQMIIEVSSALDTKIYDTRICKSAKAEEFHTYKFDSYKSAARSKFVQCWNHFIDEFLETGSYNDSQS
jgi:chromosome partitioning protein